MIYPYDEIVPLPVRNLYDSGLMQLSIATAKDMYEKGLKLLEDFYTKYGDFLSPFAKDMERYGQIVGGVRDIINNAYANGVDPLRSPEGRALVAQAIHSVNPAEINAMRANAKMGYAYQDAMQKLRSNGKFSLAQEDFDIAQNGGTAFQDFATANGRGGFNSWDRSSPIEATTLRELTQDSYKGRTPRTLTKEDFLNDQRLAGKYTYDPRYEWTGYLYSDLLKNAPGASASLAADPRAAFFRDLAKQMVIASGKKPTAENVEAQFQRNIADANTWALVDPTKEADQFALDTFRSNNDIRVAGAKAAIDFAYDKKRLTDPVFAAAAAGSGKGGKKDQFKPNIFREAEANANNVKVGVGGKFGYGVYSGDHVGYVPSGQYAELIDPITPGSYVLAKDKNSGQQVEMWKFNNTRVLNNIYTIDQYGKVQKAPISNNFGSTSYTFIPDGLMKAAKAGNSYRYYVSGTLKGDKNTSPIYNPRDNNSTQLWIEVKERGYSYDGK